MTFSIVTAWNDRGDPDRARAFEFTQRYWRRYFPDAEIVIAAPEPFTRARGLNAAVATAANDLILQADPDTIVPPEQAADALALAAAEDGLVVAFSEYLYLGEDATRRLHAEALDDVESTYSFDAADCEAYGIGSEGLVTAYTRSTWEKAGGYDERFGIWGGDDSAFAYACGAFCAPHRRVDGPALHSFHPRLPQSIPGGEGYAEQFAILAEYRDAAALGPEFVRALVDNRECGSCDYGLPMNCVCRVGRRA